MASCSEAEAPGAARGPVSSCLGPSKHEARSWCSHGPRLPLPGAPCESFPPEGAGITGTQPSSPERLGYCQGPPTGHHSLSAGRHSPATVWREVGADTAAWPDAAPAPQRHLPGPALTAQPEMGGRHCPPVGSAPASGLSPTLASGLIASLHSATAPASPTLSHRTPNGSQPHSPSLPRPPSPATTGLGEDPGAPKAGLWQVAGRAAGNRAP